MKRGLENLKLLRTSGTNCVNFSVEQNRISQSQFRTRFDIFHFPRRKCRKRDPLKIKKKTRLIKNETCSIREKSGIKENEPWCVMREVAWEKIGGEDGLEMEA